MTSEERRCARCGTLAASEQRFCSACGAPLPEQLPAEPEQPAASEEPVVSAQEPAGSTAPPPPPSKPPAAPQSVAAPPPRTAGATLPPDLSAQGRGFLGSLFDLSFTSFVTTKIIKVLYVLSMIGIGIVYLVFAAAAFNRNAAFGLLVLLIVGPLLSLFYLAWVRVTMEIAIVFFRIHESTAETASLLRHGRAT
jgi:hypothetical protein